MSNRSNTFLSSNKHLRSTASTDYFHEKAKEYNRTKNGGQYINARHKSPN